MKKLVTPFFCLLGVLFCGWVTFSSDSDVVAQMMSFMFGIFLLIAAGIYIFDDFIKPFFKILMLKYKAL